MLSLYIYGQFEESDINSESTGQPISEWIYFCTLTCPQSEANLRISLSRIDLHALFASACKLYYRMHLTRSAFSKIQAQIMHDLLDVQQRIFKIGRHAAGHSARNSNRKRSIFLRKIINLQHCASIEGKKVLKVEIPQNLSFLKCTYGRGI